MGDGTEQSGHRTPGFGGTERGPHAAAYLEQAVAAFRGALEVRTEASLPQPWGQTMRSLALTYEQTKDWAHALDTYERLAHHYPDDPDFRAKVEELSKLQ
jgi:tetratricopeptide (TPR) repeat protein